MNSQVGVLRARKVVTDELTSKEQSSPNNYSVACSQARNQGGLRGSDKPPILTSFLLEPAICINTQQ